MVIRSVGFRLVTFSTHMHAHFQDPNFYQYLKFSEKILSPNRQTDRTAVSPTDTSATKRRALQ